MCLWSSTRRLYTQHTTHIDTCMCKIRTDEDVISLPMYKGTNYTDSTVSLPTRPTPPCRAPAAALRPWSGRADRGPPALRACPSSPRLVRCRPGAVESDNVTERTCVSLETERETRETTSRTDETLTDSRTLPRYSQSVN